MDTVQAPESSLDLCVAPACEPDLDHLYDLLLFEPMQLQSFSCL